MQDNLLPSGPTIGGASSTNNGIIIQLNINQLCQLLSGNGAAAIAATEEKKDDEEDPLRSVSDSEKKRMHIQCGLADTDPTEAFPKWYRDIFAPSNPPKKDKYDIVYNAIKDAGPYMTRKSNFILSSANVSWTGIAGQGESNPPAQHWRMQLKAFHLLQCSTSRMKKWLL